MATARKTLAALNAAIVIDIPTDKNGWVAIQYPAGGTGTVVLEATLDGENWVALQVINANTGATAANLTAAGLAYARVAAYEWIRLRMSVAGSGSFTLSFSMDSFT